MTTPTHLGKYQITDVLGTGAMGVVYKGFDPGIGRTVAIKTIRRELLESDRTAGATLARFRNEARAAGRLAHPGIVAVYDYGEDHEVAYIAMEYVEGNSLREYFTHGVRFGEADAVSIASQLLDALGHAHDRRVWHRDIKPGNLIIMMDGRVKIADFGIARIEASELTQTGMVLGSPGYMAPEQYAAASIDHRADLFATGVVFYQLLTGTKPFVGTVEQIAYAVCHTEVPKPSTVDPTHPWQRYDPIFARALAKKPEERYQSAAEFRAAILEAHATSVSPVVSEATIITQILRPAAALDTSNPQRPHRIAPLRPNDTLVLSKGTRTARPWGWAIAGGLILTVTAAGVWQAYARKVVPPPAAETVAVAPPAPAPAPEVKPQSEAEVVFWESVRGSSNRAELEAYLAQYPEGTFAPLARARITALAEAEAKRAQDAEREAERRTRLAAARPPAFERKGTPEPPRFARTQEAQARSTPVAMPPVEKSNVAAPSQTPEPPPADTSRYDGNWYAEFACEAFKDIPPGGPAFVTEIRNGEMNVNWGPPRRPGNLRLRGRIDQDRLALAGTVTAGRELPARFDGQFGPEGYAGQGTLGPRKCKLTLTRATGSSS